MAVEKEKETNRSVQLYNLATHPLILFRPIFASGRRYFLLRHSYVADINKQNIVARRYFQGNRGKIRRCTPQVNIVCRTALYGSPG